jgi:hypothetical protein
VDVQSRMKKFADVYHSTIAGLNRKIMYADLRYPNGFAIRKPAEKQSGRSLDTRLAEEKNRKGERTFLLKKTQKQMVAKL